MRTLVILIALIGAANAAPPKKTIKVMKDRLNTVRTKKEDVKKQLRQTKRAVSAVETDIVKVDARLNDVETRLAATRDRLAKARTQQQVAQQELRKSQAALEKSKQQVRRRLRTVYTTQEGSFLSAVSGAANAGDLASRTYLMERVTSADHALFQNFTELKQQAEQHKQRCDELVINVNSLVKQAEAQSEELKVARDRKESYLGELQDRQGELEDLNAQFEKDEARIEGQIEAYLANLKRTSNSNVRFTGRLSKPIDSPITSRFGMRFHPILKITRLHAGIDFGASVGTSIHAAADGVVINAEYMSGFGNVVIIDHGGGLATVYGHCSRTFVHQGQHVTRGQPIAAVGNSGLSTGPHLHFEVRVNGKAVNPLSKL